ncbi:unnamed protein product [Paramecium primaurelia]|uniref:Pyruvate dehydrogenase E1 component subunit alpha n=2 Tax=Paramecium TaxID=5884 RepID=A0A8S1XSL2_9CILI|nr:unnamed protein product [Paramecium primaurelia]CAD8203788.1 unnamed protein product [Paramecium pentaurelia]
MIFRISRSCFSSISVKLPPFKVHHLELDQLPQTTTTTSAELLAYYKSMQLQRRMEIACDNLYKQRLIRGFLHLADGQESIYEGLHAALTFDDCVITAYRDHCIALLRGDTPHQIIAEMMAKQTGSTKGKGGSMHYYKKATNFYGGHGIVGAQIPLGTGLAFAQKYNKKPNVTLIMFGDGAANQGQLYEAANMAQLWHLPAIYFIENNLFGMGTSIDRASANTKFYTRGDVIPGIQIDGNNVFQVRETLKFAKKHCLDKGPIFIEAMTYRYHGHSMSDPGVTYRTREEVQQQRKTRDCINYVKNIILENKVADEHQLEEIDNTAQNEIDIAVEQAKVDPVPPSTELTTDVYVDNQNHFIRGILYKDSILPKSQ